MKRYKVGVGIALWSLILFGTAEVRLQAAEEAAVDPTPASEQPASIAGLARSLETIAGELELIRNEMGRPRANDSGFEIRDAHLRNVYQHALTLDEKVGRLAFEHTFSATPDPVNHVPRDVTEADIQGIFNRAIEQLSTVKKSMSITEQVALEPAVAEPLNTADLLITIIALNRQLNLLLDRRYAPRDVYRKVTLGVHYMARILDRFPDTRHIPEEPALKRGKTPTDVYARLLACHEQLVPICQAADIPIPVFVEHEKNHQRVPSDVYDLAVLVATDLSFIHASMQDLEDPVPVLDPGRKFPSHVFQRVGLLQKQIALLSENTTKQTDWLQP